MRWPTLVADGLRRWHHALMTEGNDNDDSRLAVTQVTGPSAVADTDLSAVREVLRLPGGELMLARQDRQPVTLPTALSALLLEVVGALSRGEGVALYTIGTELSPRQAGDILNVSLQYVARLMDAGTLPFHRVGAHRRVLLEDVLAYKRTRDAERDEALTNLVRQSEELGLYPELD